MTHFRGGEKGKRNMMGSEAIEKTEKTIFRDRLKCPKKRKEVNNSGLLSPGEAIRKRSFRKKGGGDWIYAGNGPG